MTKALLVLLAILADTGTRRTNLLDSRWEKIHGPKFGDPSGVEVGPAITWFRRAGEESGAAGVYQTLQRQTRGRFVLDLEVRVDEQSLGGSCWSFDADGVAGDYPVKVQVDYLDAQERPKVWLHRFLADCDPQSLTNCTRVSPATWTRVRLDIDLRGQGSITRVSLYGTGPSFRGSARNVRLLRR
ncbi:MAG: hypothetical protein HYY17_01935 [Planctomycetes bacterium]|nr:hypothetical protein [Planctomycetota bacterium]